MTEEARFRPGMEGSVDLRVTPEMTAASYGNEGVEVLATPYLIGMLENAAVRAIHAELRSGEATVGTRVDVRHEAATPVGLTVTFRARLESAEGPRLTFYVEAHDGVERVASGVHQRYVIDLDRFLARINKKRPASR